MPLFDDVPCKVCSKGQLPAGSRFCPNCGRPVHWTESPAGRRRAAGVGVVAAVAVVLLVGFVLLAVTQVSRAPRAVAVVPARPTNSPMPTPTPTPMPPSPSPSPSLTRIPSTFPPVGVPTPTPSPPPPADANGDGVTELTADPLAAYAGGPPGDRLMVRGIRVGTPAIAVPTSILTERAADHLRDVDGNLYALDRGGSVSEIHVRDPDVLARLPIDSTHALTGHFGTPDDVYTDADGGLYTYLYPARGVDVRWDAKAGRIDELVLRRPGGGR